MAAVLAGARQVVGLDTGFTHLAAALGRPTLGIYCDHEPGLAGITGPGPRGQHRRQGPGAVARRCDGAAGNPARRPIRQPDGPALQRVDALRRVAVPAQAAGALPEVVLGLEAAGRAAVALQRLGGARHGLRAAPARPAAASCSAARPAAAARPTGVGCCCRCEQQARSNAGRVVVRAVASARSSSTAGSCAPGPTPGRLVRPRPAPLARAACGVVAGDQQEGRRDGARASVSQAASACCGLAVAQQRAGRSAAAAAAPAVPPCAPAAARRRRRRHGPPASASCGELALVVRDARWRTSRRRLRSSWRATSTARAPVARALVQRQQRQPRLGRRRACLPAPARPLRRGRTGRPS